MNRVLATWFVLLFLFSNCFPQVHPGARQIALARSNVSTSQDVFSIYNNPAGLSSLISRTGGIFYSPAPFGIKELSTGSAAFCEPTSIGSFGAGFSIYGFDLYRETSMALGYGRKITSDFSIGITSIYRNISIKNYGNKGLLLINAGANVRLSSKINLGFIIENATRSSLINYANQIPVVLYLGTDLRFIKEITFSAAIKKEIGFNPSISLGTEYSIIDFLKLRIGAGNEPAIYCGGFGLYYNFLQIDYAISSHADLGLTHQFGLIIHFPK